MVIFRWGFNTATHGWTQYDVSLNVPERPSWGAFAEAPNYGLAFYLNGLLSNESSLGTAGANITTRTLEGLVVINLQNHTVWWLIAKEGAMLRSSHRLRIDLQI